MNSERFEALIDAIIAIIITIIVIEIPLAANGSLEALLDLKLEFIIYATSFLVCFNYWNYNQNLFHLVNKINNRTIWLGGISLLILSFLPYLTMFVANNFNSLLAQSLYGLDFMLITILCYYTYKSLKKADPANIALQLGMGQTKEFKSTLIMIAIGYVIGFTIYPPAIIILCIMSIFITKLIIKKNKRG